MSHIVNGACPLDCPDTCAWQIEVVDGKAVRMRGRKDHPYTRGSLCGKVNHYLDAVYAPDRLTTPMRRVGEKGDGAFQAIDWDEAIGLAATGIQTAIDRHGAEAVLPYYYAGTLGAVQGWSLGQRLFKHLGATRLGTTICTGAATAAMKATMHRPVGTDPEDFIHAPDSRLGRQSALVEHAPVALHPRCPTGRRPCRRNRSVADGHGAPMR